MQNNNKMFLQKVKDNVFYVALGLGLVAILAVVAVYTVRQNGRQLASNDLDLNMASDYSPITEDDSTRTHEGTVARKTTTEAVNPDTAIEEASAPVDLDASEETTQEATEEATTQEEVKLPVTTDVGALDFNSEKTLSWPVSGEVILPYSMETTVYFKTLDQYKCNPGMMIAAGNGTTVKNAYLGQVTKVTSDNVYGNMVTVYLGNDYSVVYGQLDTIYVKEGDYVKVGESIGTIGTPTDSFSEEGSHLFFQMYEGEKAIDPLLFVE